jgi:hypothetical protein
LRKPPSGPQNPVKSLRRRDKGRPAALRQGSPMLKNRFDSPMLCVSFKMTLVEGS